MKKDLVVVIGVRGFGLPCARRLGPGNRLLIADIDADNLAAAEEALRCEGHDVTAMRLDIADPASIAMLTARAAGLGFLRTLVCTAGLSPNMASAERIFAVNMLGTIGVIDGFAPLTGHGTVAVMLASNAAYLAPVPPEVEQKLALAPAEELMDVVRQCEGHDTGLGAYWLAKRANQLRVEAEAPRWGRRGARIVSVSPGVMATEMSRIERDSGSPIDEAVAGTPVGRIGSPEDIVAAVAWVASPQASFVTGTDLLVDGGMIASLRWTDFATADPTASN